MKKVRLLSIAIVLLVTNCNEPNGKQKVDMRVRAITANFNSFIENAWNQKNMDSLRSISTENYIRHLNGIEVATNQNELEANMGIYFKGFPDLKLTIDRSTIKDGHLYAKWTFEGTNTGVFGEAPATGKSIVVSGYSEISFDSEGKMTQEDVYYNELALLQQLGYTLNPPIVE
ncbi:MAG: ester cyclase [Maribacter sp.]|nr:ester cyclase [Maribacter sp.]